MRMLALAPLRNSPCHAPRPCRGALLQIGAKTGLLEHEAVLHRVRGGEQLRQLWLDPTVIAPVHQQQRPPLGSKGGDLSLMGLHTAQQRGGLRRQRRSVRVADRQILRPYAATVGRRPFESAPPDRRGNSAPDHRVLEPGESKYLRHLGHVAEHVRQVANPRRPP